MFRESVRWREHRVRQLVAMLQRIELQLSECTPDHVDRSILEIGKAAIKEELQTLGRQLKACRDYLIV